MPKEGHFSCLWPPQHAAYARFVRRSRLKPMRYRLALPLVVAVTSLALRQLVLRPQLEGTYSLLVCRGGCGNRDSSRAYVQGILVFTDSTFTIRSLPAEARDQLEFSY